MSIHSESPLAHLPTPGLLLDQQRMDRNIARLQQHLGRLGVGLRPHLKTSLEADRWNTSS